MADRKALAGLAPSELALLAAVVAGAVLRIDALSDAALRYDAHRYVELARQFSWLDPWRASFREPLWIVIVKVTVGPFGYSAANLQFVGCALAVVALAACGWAFRNALTDRPWLAAVATCGVAVSVQLTNDAVGGTRDVLTPLIVAGAVAVVAHRPGALPVVGALALGVRWELGTALLVCSVLLAVGRVVTLRDLLRGAAVGAVLVGPFMVNNAVTYGDPMFHSNVHAMVNRNIERWDGDPKLGLPREERLHPQMDAEVWRGPLITWTEFAAMLGADTIVDREVDAVRTLPADALRLGRLPAWSGWLLLAFAVVGVVRRRDRLVLLLVVLTGSSLVGYGLILPHLDPRLVGSLGVPLLLLAALGVSGRPETAELESTEV